MWFTKDEILAFRKLVASKLGEKGVPSNFEKITAKQLEYIFELYDRLLFKGDLTKKLKTSNSKLLFSTSVIKNASHAGLCTQNRKHGVRECTYTLTLPYAFYVKLFNKGETSYYNGGIECNTRLECYIITFEHELCHFIHHLFIDQSLAISGRKYTLGHGRLFMCLMRKVFYLEHYRHNMAEGADAREILTKATTSIGQVVQFTTNKGVAYKAIVIAKLPVNARVIVYEVDSTGIVKVVNSDKSPGEWRLPYEVLRPSTLSQTERKRIESMKLSHESKHGVALTKSTAVLGGLVTFTNNGIVHVGVLLKKNPATALVVEIEDELDGGDALHWTHTISTDSVVKGSYKLFKLYADATSSDKAKAMSMYTRYKKNEYILYNSL